jgi:recombination protein RecT
MTAAQLGMEPNTPRGQAYLIPYWNSKARCLECQFQLGYKGLIDLAYRSGDVSVIQAQIVYENDEFSYSFGLEPELKHVPAPHDRGSATHVYAIFRTKDGGYGFEVMSIDDVREHAKRYSKAYDSGPWQTNFEEMAKKTVLKRVLKYAPLKSDFVRGIAQDETDKTEISDDMYTVPEQVIEVDEETGEVISDTPAQDQTDNQ